MKKIFTLLFFSFCFSAFAQAPFWTENFGTGCNRGQVVAAYTGTNGNWSVASTGVNEANPNAWYVSGTAAGTSVGTCNSDCLLAATTNQSLHIGNPEVDLSGFGIYIGPDTGSTYLTGVYCAFGICSITNSRAESPTIDCSNQSSISISFLYYENGQGTTDDATLMYSSDGGLGWTQIDPIAKAGAACNPMLGGTWTAFSVNLPASANLNPNVKIGFNWTNNGSGGTDPSFAVDDIVLSGIAGGGPTITTGAVTGSPFCAGDSLVVPYTITGSFTGGNIFTAQLSDGVGSFASPTTIGTVAATTAGNINCGIPMGTPTGAGYMIRIISSTPSVTGTSVGPITINAAPAATANNSGPYCAPTTIQLNSPAGSATDDWMGPMGYTVNNVQNPTIASSTVAMSGIYTVTVTNGSGCSATATTSVTVLDCSGIELEEAMQLSIYPNPTSDQFTISINENIVADTKISLLNLVGQTVYSISPGQGKTVLSAESLGLKAGIYLVQIKYKNQTKVVRLIKR